MKTYKAKTVLHVTVADNAIQDPSACDSPAKALPYLEKIRAMDRECFVGIYLNTRGQVLATELISMGTLSASLVHPREVFKVALLMNAAAIIVAHNHPSGGTMPSSEDKDATRRLCRAGELLGVPVMDHLIVAKDGHYSFKENGALS